MPTFFDLLYGTGLVFLAPWLAYKALTAGKYRRGLWSKLSGAVPSSVLSTPYSVLQTAWFHGVSVGEVHLLRQVVAAFRRHHPDWRCVISTTTDTGFEEARKRFPDLPVFFWPFDFSWAVRRALAAVRPDLVVLAEGELWPNFLRAAKAQGVPVAVVNARMSPRSFYRYRRLGPLARGMLNRVNLFAVQTEEYAENLCRLGVPPDRVQVTGNVKYDGVETDRHNPKTQELRRLFGIAMDDLVWVAGSTQAPEEEIALGIFRRARAAHPNLRLIVVPRQKDRFEEVATLLRRAGVPFVRRSELSASPLSPLPSPLILVDTIGELGAVWGLADVAFVGGSLDGRRGGQNMIEPAAYGAAVVFGPHVWNFRDAVERLRDARGAVQVADARELEAAARRLLADADERQRLGTAARELVLRQQGATERSIALLASLLADRHREPRAA